MMSHIIESKPVDHHHLFRLQFEGIYKDQIANDCLQLQHVYDDLTPTYCDKGTEFANEVFEINPLLRFIRNVLRVLVGNIGGCFLI